MTQYGTKHYANQIYDSAYTMSLWKFHILFHMGNFILCGVHMGNSGFSHVKFLASPIFHM
jgi:hypothetical protein